MFFVKPKKFLGFGRHKPIVEFSIAQIHLRPQAHPPLTVEFCCRVAKHVGQINRSLLHAANSNPRGENAESASRAASCQVLRLLFLLCSSAAGQGCRWYVAAEVAFFALRRAGYWWLRGGAKFRWRVAAEGGGCALRRVAAARRSGVPLAGCSGGWWLRGGAVFSLACYSGVCFFRYTPRGVLRCHRTRGALRPLFLLRSCAADQEKRPEKKSWAVMACAPVRLERFGDTCIRSAPRCISRR